MGLRENPAAVPLCRLVARAAELRTLVHLWRSSRLVSLFGASGVGKSALARAAAAELAADHSERVLCLDARGAATGTAVLRLLVKARGRASGQDHPSTFGGAVAGTHGNGGTRPTSGVCPRVVRMAPAGREGASPASFLLLDDLPLSAHAAVRGILQWLVTHPDVHLLMVSHRPLDLVGEQVLPLAPLAVPAAEETTGQAVELFQYYAGRARPNGPPFTADLAAAICRALGGLPAALEAAAGLAGALPDAEILRIAREEPLGLRLRGQPLRAAVAATWEDLPAEGRDYLAANAAWPEGFSDEAGAELYGGEHAPVVAASLVQLGLLRIIESHPRPWYSMSPLVRGFAHETGVARARERQERLARHLLCVVERHAEFRGEQRPRGEMRGELAALRWAWRWLAGQPDGDAVRRFARALAGPLRHELGEPEEAKELLESALAAARVAGAEETAALESMLAAAECRLGQLALAEARLRALLATERRADRTVTVRLRLASVLAHRGQLTAAVENRLAAIAQLRVAGGDAPGAGELRSAPDEQGRSAEAALAWALLAQAEDQRRLGNRDAAEAEVEESGTLFARLGCPFGHAAVLAARGVLHADRGETEEAAWHARESRAVAERAGDRPGRARALQLEARMATDPVRGLELAEEAVTLWEAMCRPAELAAALVELSELSQAHGQPAERALASARGALQIARRDGFAALEADALLGLAEIYQQTGRPELAEDYAAAARRACDRTEDRRVRRRYQRWLETRERSLGTANFHLNIENCKLAIADSSPRPPLLIRLLGALTVEGPGGVLPAERFRPKEQRVLARLALEPGRLAPRDQLLDLFWPDSGVITSERSLRTVVSSLRGTLRSVLAGPAPRLISARLDGYCLEPAACAVDGSLFAAAVQAARAATANGSAGEAMAAWRRAVELYRGDLLSAFPYEDWCVAVRERLRDDFLDALIHLARAAMSAGALEEARALASRMVEIDATQERAHRLLMRCYALLDRPAEAIRQFERCRTALQEELAARPAAATVALLQAIRSGAIVVPEEEAERSQEALSGRRLFW